MADRSAAVLIPRTAPATEWVDGGWKVQDSATLVQQLAPLGVDLVDCSSAGNTTYEHV